MALIDKLTAIADGFRYSRGTTKSYTLEEMAILAAEKVISKFTYEVGSYFTNVTGSNTATSLTEGDSYTTTITPNSGFTMDSVVVLIDGLNVTSSVYDSSTGTISINNVIGNIVIYAVATQTAVSGMYTITNNLSNVTTNNSGTSIYQDFTYIATLTANDGYEIKSITVTMGGIDVTGNVVTNGAISIGRVTGNIVITAIAVKI